MRTVHAEICGEVLARLEELVETTQAKDLAQALAHSVFHYSELRRQLNSESKFLAVVDRDTGMATHVVLPMIFKERLRLLPPE